MTFLSFTVNTAFFLARMFATSHLFTRPVAADIGDLLPTLFHLFVAAGELNFFRFLTFPSDLNRTFLLVWRRMIAAGKPEVDKVVAEGMPMNFPADALTAVKSTII